jgi:hypothetical protein
MERKTNENLETYVSGPHVKYLISALLISFGTAAFIVTGVLLVVRIVF